MIERKVTLYWMCKTEQGWKRFPAAVGRNGKLRPRFAQVGNAQKFYETGHYECRFLNDEGKPSWKNVGEDAAIAQSQQIHTARTLTAQFAAHAVGTEIVETPGRVQLKIKANEYEKRQIARGKKRAAVTFRTAIDEFMSVIRVPYADQITETLIMRWYTALREKNAARTIYNKHVSVFGFLTWAGIDTKRLAQKAPSFTEKAVEVYRTDELTKLFASLTDPYHQIVFKVLLKTGLRMQEAMFLEWHQFDFKSGTLTVRERNEDGFEIKDRAERMLPIPADLIKALKVWKETHSGKLALGTSNDTPNWKWLPLLKRLVRQAGLNCGHCKGCVEQNECERWYLHKFRATYTTFLLRSGLDPRTVMGYTGHADLATIMRYLAPAELPDTQSKINSIAWGDVVTRTKLRKINDEERQALLRR
jgi:integrase